MLAISQALLVDQQAEGAVAVTPHGFRQSGCDTSTHFVQWAEGTAAGEVVVEQGPTESADDEDWVVEATVTFVGPAPKTDRVVVTGAHGAIRHRVSGVVVDGFVTTRIVGSAPE